MHGPRPENRSAKVRRESAGRRGQGGRKGPVYAAVDLGTNNCRLLVARPDGARLKVIDSFSRIVRLGEGVGLNGHLSDQAMDRTIAALKVCASKMRRRGVTRARNVATEACRRAANGAEFCDRVRRETGLDLDIISTEEEVRLALAGCTPLLDGGYGHALMFDIGGGSTELIWLDLTENQPRLAGWKSLPLGVVTLAEHYGGDTVPDHVFDAMVAEVHEGLRDFEGAHGIHQVATTTGIQLLGSSGTVTTLAAIAAGLKRYDRAKVDGAWLPLPEMLGVSRTLRRMSCAERAAEPCIGDGRADLVVAGCAILEAVVAAWPSDRLRVADRGLREGMLMGLMAESTPGPDQAAN